MSDGFGVHITFYPPGGIWNLCLYHTLIVEGQKRGLDIQNDFCAEGAFRLGTHGHGGLQLRGTGEETDRIISWLGIEGYEKYKTPIDTHCYHDKGCCVELHGVWYPEYRSILSLFLLLLKDCGCTILEKKNC